MESYDNVFSKETGQNLTLEYMDLLNSYRSRRYCYQRGTSSNFLEIFIEDLLNKFSDDTPYVEYMLRTTWLDLPCFCGNDITIPKNMYYIFLTGDYEAFTPSLFFPFDFSKVIRCSPIQGRVLKMKGDWYQFTPKPINTVIWDGFYQKSLYRPVLVLYTFDHAPLVPLPIQNSTVYECYPKDQWKPITPIPAPENGHGSNLIIRFSTREVARGRFTPIRLMNTTTSFVEIPVEDNFYEFPLFTG